MIVCPKCSKENQDHYKFCLGCGAELPRDAAPKKFSGDDSSPAHAAAPIADESTSLGQGDGGPEVGGEVVCPQCSHSNPPSNKFCASCGFKLGKSASTAPAAAAEAEADANDAASAAMAGAARAPASTSAPRAAGSGMVLTALRADGTEAGTYEVPPGSATIGRDTGGVFAGDSYLSPRHATFIQKDGKVTVRDESSLNGVYRRLQRDEPIPLNFDDIFRIGQEIMKIEPLTPMPPGADGVERLGSPSKGYIARMALVIGRDTTGNAYPIPESGLHLGRERGEVLFPEDGYVSGLHCRLAYENGQLFMTDLGSSNGSFVRLQKETEITNGDILLMGQQLFRIAM